MRMKWSFVRPGVFATLVGALLAATMAMASSTEAVAQTSAQRIKLLEQTVQELLKRDEERERKMKAMQAELDRQAKARGLTKAMPRKKEAAQDRDHDHHGHDHGQEKKPAENKDAGHDHAHDHGSGDVWSATVGEGVLRLSRIGLDLDFAAGTGTHIEKLFGGHHDPQRTGFTLQGAEISVSGGYDPYFDAFLSAVLTVDGGGETTLELEEAWLRSKWLGGGILRLQGGQFFTPFGLTNRTHLHDWAWQTQPVIATRVFGADGARGLGIQAEARLLGDGPLSGHLFLSMQNRRSVHIHGGHDDDHDDHDEHGGDVDIDGFGDLAYALRLENRLSLSKQTSFTFGGSAMFEPNPNGDDSRVTTLGADVTVRHRLPSKDRLVLTAEFMHRTSKSRPHEEDHDEDEEEDHDEHTERHRLYDYGLYVQGLWQAPAGWGLGLRYEYATGSGGEMRSTNSMRDNRTRISPLLLWQFSEFGRLKLQYNYDRADFLKDKEAHSVFLSANWSFGLGTPDHAGHDH